MKTYNTVAIQTDINGVDSNEELTALFAKALELCQTAKTSEEICCSSSSSTQYLSCENETESKTIKAEMDYNECLESMQTVCAQIKQEITDAREEALENHSSSIAVCELHVDEEEGHSVVGDQDMMNKIMEETTNLEKHPATVQDNLYSIQQERNTDQRTKKKQSIKKQHICPYCNKECQHGGNLKVHIRIHTNERPFQCQHCETAEVNQLPENAELDIEMFEAEPISDQDIPETSIDDRTSDIEMSTGIPDAERSFQIVEEGTKKKKTKLVDSVGFTYNVKSRRSYATYWQCTVRPKQNRCKATVKERDGKFTLGLHPHNHVATAGSALLATNIIKAVKAKAMEDKFKPASVIVKEVLLEQLTDGPCSALPEPVNIARSANRLRQSMRSEEPQNLDFQLHHEAIPEGFLKADVQVKDRRHWMFITDRQLEMLAMNTLEN